MNNYIKLYILTTENIWGQLIGKDILSQLSLMNWFLYNDDFKLKILFQWRRDKNYRFSFLKYMFRNYNFKHSKVF